MRPSLSPTDSAAETGDGTGRGGWRGPREPAREHLEERKRYRPELRGDGHRKENLMKAKRILWFALPILVAAAAAFFGFLRSSTAPVSFRSVTVERGDVVATVGATGKVGAVSTVQVGSQVSGIIWELYADFNSQVRKGQVVARLEPSLFESRLIEARANLATASANVERAKVAVEDARRKFERSRELAAQNLLPQSELDVAQLAYERAGAELKASEAQLQQAEASVAQAEVNLAHTVIHSPIDGVVVSRNVDVGQTVAASFQAPTLFTIAEDLRKMRVVASVDEADIGNIQAGQKARFRVDAFPEDDFEGTVSQVRLAPIEVQNVVTYDVLVDVDNRDLKLLPGMTANVTFEVARHTDILRVPNAALRYRPDPSLLVEDEGWESGSKRPFQVKTKGKANGDRSPSARGVSDGPPPGSGRPRNAVYAIQADGKLRRVTVQVGLTDGSFTEIAGGGIKEGDILATGLGDTTVSTDQGRPNPMRFLGFGPRRR